jgi:hypothetical protein
MGDWDECGVADANEKLHVKRRITRRDFVEQCKVF